MQSIIDQLGTQDFIRVRLGIQPITPFKGALEDYVLGKLTAKEKSALKKVIEKIPLIVETLLKNGVEEAMNEFNG